MTVMITSETFDFASTSSRVYLDNGFLRVTGRAARTGVYQYLASELGLTDRPGNQTVNVYRPSEEVFDDASIATYSNVDVTNDHPSKLVNADTYKGVSVGHVLSATQEGDFVNVEMIIKDAEAITAVETGKSQLSPGYTAVYVMEDGQSPDGMTYEFKQTSIEVNHVAIVLRGRGGEQVRINDNLGVITMIKVTLDSGRSIEVENEATALLVTDSIERLTDKVTTADADKSTAEADKSTAEAQRDVLQEKLDVAVIASSDAAISERVKEIATVTADAVKIAGDTFTCDSMDVTTIKRSALAVKRPSMDWADKDEGYVKTAFELASLDAVTVTVPQTPTQLQQLALDAAGVPPVKPKLTRDQAYRDELYSRSK